MTKKLKGSLLLLLAAIIWGTAFVAQSEGMNYVEPFTYNAVRTLLGGIVLVPVVFIAERFRNRSETEADKKASLKTTVTGGSICGIFLFLASSLQQSGISMTTAGKAGFITSLYIIIVPLIEFVLLKRSSLKIWLNVLLAAAGFYLLCIGEGFKISRGDILVLFSALFFAFHIIIVDFFNKKNTNGILMSCIQFFTAGLLMAVSMFIFEKPSLNAVLNARYTILYAGVMSCGIAYTFQIAGQRNTPPATATLIMSRESVFAALSGWLLLGEKLSAKELSGCVLVFAAVIIAQLVPDYAVRSQNKKQSKS